MKKILNVFLVFLFSFLFMSNVFASANVNIKSLEIADKTSTINVNSYSYEGLGIKTDIFFNQVGDYVKFKVVLKNNDNIDYIISDIKSNYQNEYTDIVYEYENNSKDFRANSEKALFVTFKYTKEATDVTVLNGTEIKLTIPLDTISNPKTGIKEVSNILLVGLLIGLVSFVFFRKNQKILVVMFAFTLIGSTIYLTNAAQQLQIDLNVEVTMDAPTTGKAIFDRGVNVASRMFDLSGINYDKNTNSDGLILSISLECSGKLKDSVGLNNNIIRRVFTIDRFNYDPLPENEYACANKILNFKRSESIEDKYKTDEYKVSSSESAIPIYMWYEEATKTIYWYSEAPIVYLNEDATGMFGGLAYVSSLDLSTIRTKYTKNFSSLFGLMANIKQLDVSNFDTSNGEHFDGMFYGMKKLENIDVSNFDISKAEDLNFIFFDDRSLTKLDLSSWKNDNGVFISDLFDYSVNLKEIDMSSLKLKNDSSEMYTFSNLPSLEKIKTPKVMNDYTKYLLETAFADDKNNYYGVIDSNTPTAIWIYKTDLISFTLHDYVNCETNKDFVNCSGNGKFENVMFAEPDMKWSEWIESKYNTLEVNFVEYRNYCSSDNEREKHLYPIYREESGSRGMAGTYNTSVNYDDFVMPNTIYEYRIDECPIKE